MSQTKELNAHCSCEPTNTFLQTSQWKQKLASIAWNWCFHCGQFTASKWVFTKNH